MLVTVHYKTATQDDFDYDELYVHLSKADGKAPFDEVIVRFTDMASDAASKPAIITHFDVDPLVEYHA